MNPALYDVDDLISREQIERYLVPLREANEAFAITCYAIPNKIGPVTLLKQRYPWISFGIHGWEHAPFECLGWSYEKTFEVMQRALDMGFDKLFKPPNWCSTDWVEEACEKLGLVLHHHDNYTPKHPGLRHYHAALSVMPRHTPVHTHITYSPVTDFIETHPGFTTAAVKTFDEFWTPDRCAIEVADLGGLK